MQITTNRLLLRELNPIDLNDIQEYATDPQVIKYMTFGPNTKEDTRNFIELCRETVKKHREEAMNSA